MYVWVVTCGERGEGRSPKAVIGGYKRARDYVMDHWPHAIPDKDDRDTWWVSECDLVSIERFRVQ